MNTLFAKSVTKAIDLNACPKEAYNFLADPMNWPKYAIINLRSVKKGQNGWYDLETIHGTGQLKMLSNEELGILDHIWKDNQASWTVYSRVIPNQKGSTFLMTFFQPANMDEEMFSKAMEGMDIEFAVLKTILDVCPAGERGRDT